MSKGNLLFDKTVWNMRKVYCIDCLKMDTGFSNILQTSFEYIKSDHYFSMNIYY